MATFFLPRFSHISPFSVIRICFLAFYLALLERFGPDFDRIIREVLYTWPPEYFGCQMVVVCLPSAANSYYNPLVVRVYPPVCEILIRTIGLYNLILYRNEKLSFFWHFL